MEQLEETGKFLDSFTKCKLKQGETKYMASGRMAALSFTDKKHVGLVHLPDKTSWSKRRDHNGNHLTKPTFMGAEDKNEAINHKWTTKVALHINEEAIFNAFILYSFKNQLKYLDFKLSVIAYDIAARNAEEVWSTFLEKNPITEKKIQPRGLLSALKLERKSNLTCVRVVRGKLCVVPCFREYHVR